jgi:hypothetical protein
MRLLTSIVLILSCLVGVVAGQDATPSQFTVLSWNVDSGQAEPQIVALQISQIKGVDLWGLCEVRDESSARLFEGAANQDEPGRFARVLSPTAGSDRSCILFDRAKFEGLGCIELPWRGHRWYHRSLGLRPGLAVHLRHRATGLGLYFVVNRFYTPTSDEQAVVLNQWAAGQDIPVIAVGTYDFPYRQETGPVYNAGRQGYAALTADGIFRWLKPAQPIPTIRRDGFDTTDDFIFLAGNGQSLSGQSWVLVEGRDFPNDGMTSNHRPIMATLTVQPSAANR